MIKEAIVKIVSKEDLTYEEAYTIIESGIGTHFDPIIAQEFLNIKEKTAAVNESFKLSNYDITD